MKNLIIITADEMRADCLGYAGNPDVKTPNIDAFASKGVVFRNHFCVHGKCVPSRASMMTGRYSHTDGFRTISQHVPENQPNVLNSLKAAGYETAVFGHNHVWENFYGDNTKSSGVVDYHSYTKDYFDYFIKNKVDVPPENPELKRIQMPEGYDYYGQLTEPITGFSDYNRTAQALHYLSEVRDTSKPFFMQLDFGFPHPDYKVEEPFFSMYDRNAISVWTYELPNNAPSYMEKLRTVRIGEVPSEEFLREIQAVYYGMITRTDMLIGQLLQKIEAQGLLENTVVLFTSDHGEFAGQYGLVEKWDTCMLDCIMRVPLILYAPELPHGTDVESLSEHVDIAPTILDLLDLPANWGMHGGTLVSLVNGETQKRAVFADGGHEDEMVSRISVDQFNSRYITSKQLAYIDNPASMKRVKMVRTKDWKLIVRADGEHELYHVKFDPEELQNLYNDNSLENRIEIILDLQHKLIEWCMKTDTDRPYQHEVLA